MGLTGDITQDMADAVVSWGPGNGTAADNGSYYASLPTPYQEKTQDFEAVEELLLVNGFTRELLYGQSVATAPAPTIGLGQNSAMSAPTLTTDPEAANGISDFLTVFTPIVAASRTSQAGAKVNIIAAPYEVLVAMLTGGGDGNAEGDASSIIASRTLDDMDPSDITNLWPSSASNASLAVGNSVYSQFSADIVAVSANGRAFKRVRVVIDASQNQTVPIIVYRRRHHGARLADRSGDFDQFACRATRAQCAGYF